MSTVKNYLSLVRFSHTIFAMPFALIGFFLGIYSPVAFLSSTNQWNLNRIIGWGWDNAHFVYDTIVVTRFFLVIICMTTARSAAMAFKPVFRQKL